jgi:hypothetical protein
MTQPVEIFYVVPVGTVIAWYPPPKAQLPPGFAYCNGALITDSDSPFDGTYAPNLVNCFVLGAGSGVAPNQQGGSVGYNLNGWNSGTLSTGPTQVSVPQDNVQNDIIQHNNRSTSNWRYDLTDDHDSWNDGNHHHQLTGITVPAPGWVALVYLMRIK